MANEVEYFDAIGQLLTVGQRCFYMNSTKSQVGDFCVIKEILENGSFRILKENSFREQLSTVKLAERFIVLDVIYEQHPHLAI